MKKLITLLSLTLFTLTLLTAQGTVKPKPIEAPDRGRAPEQEYPITNVVRNDAMATFAGDFKIDNVGFLHVYVDPMIDPEEGYLLEGEEISSTTRALLPQAIQKKAKMMNAKLYGTMKFGGLNETLYVLRMDGQRSDRIELLAMRDNKIVHLKTLATRECTSGGCKQLDSFITDVDGDGTIDLIQRKRWSTKTGEKISKPTAYVMNDNKQWKRTRKLDLPMNSLNVYRRSTDN